MTPMTPMTPKHQTNSQHFILLSLPMTQNSKKMKDFDDDVNSKYDGKPEVLILFIVFGLALGVIVFLLGVGVSVVVDNFELGDFGHSARRWLDINPELILYLFLPALIFGEAMSLNWHHVKGSFLQSFLLAGPGVILGAFGMALFVRFILPLNWTWNTCMILGSILSATDPVAVVALLKNAGASPKLTMLIVGESLMNDGTAMVLFTLYYNLMKGDQYDTSKIFLFFLSTCIGSPMLGIGIGFVGVYWLGRANRPLSGDDVTFQIVVTVCVAYLVFFIAQYECEMSGVLACCGAGSVFAWLAPPLILEHETMHNVWSFIEWVGNTLIFLLAGLIIGSETQKEIGLTDWLYMAAIYVVLFTLRGGIIAVLYPSISNVGLKCSVADAKFLAWSGLRGALGMALSLIVFSDYEEINLNKDDANKLFFYVGGVASLTLIINAPTAQFVLSYLGLTKDEFSPEVVNNISQVRLKLKKKSMDDLEALQSDKYLIQGHVLEKFVSLLQVEDDRDLRCSIAMETLRKQSFSRRGSAEDVAEDMLKYCRTMFLECVRSKYWKFIADGKMPRQSKVTQSLLYSIDNALDRVHKNNLRDWKWLKSEMQLNQYMMQFTEMYRSYTPEWFPYHAMGDVIVTRNVYFRVYLLTNFIDAHEDAQRKFLGFMGGETEADMGTEEGMEEAPQPQTVTVEQAQVLRESINLVKEARTLLLSIDPDYVTSIVSQQASRIILARQTEIVREMVEEGLLLPKAAEAFFDAIQSDVLKLDLAQSETFRDNVQVTASRRTVALASDSLRDPYLSVLSFIHSGGDTDLDRSNNINEESSSREPLLREKDN